MVPENLLYTKDHEWTQIQGDVAIIGIDDYAQHSLGEITFIELPAVKKKLNVHDTIAAVESSKAASDVYSPFAGEIIEVNEELSSRPELINQDCYKSGWICKIKISNPDTRHLMNSAQYEEYLKTI
ncbi:MAG: glycine cleavage system protein GcvH [Phycisphaerales bacterium]